jgi:hypothetical protein
VVTVDVRSVVAPTSALPNAAPGQTFTVNTLTALQSRIDDFDPANGCRHVVWNGGNIPGGFTIAAVGTAAAPFVFRSNAPRTIQIGGTVTLTGKYCILAEFWHPNTGVVIKGTGNRCTRSKFQIGLPGVAGYFDTGSNGRFDHNDVTAAAPTVTGQDRYGCSWECGDSFVAHVGALVDRNDFHNFPTKFTPGDYWSSFNRPCRVGVDNQNSMVDFDAKIHYNLIRDCDPGFAEGILELKASGCEVVGNTMVNCGQGQMKHRQGANTLWEANWIENSNGLFILGRDHKIYGNKADKIVTPWGTDYLVVPYSTASNKTIDNPGPVNIKFIGNNGPLSSQQTDRPAEPKDCLLENHTGTADLAGWDNVTDRRAQPSSVTHLTAVKLTTAQVGPLAP